MPPRRILSAITAILSVFAGWIAAPAHAAETDPYQEILRFQYGADRRALDRIDEEIRQAAPSEYPAIEKKLLTAMQALDATVDCKRILSLRLKEIASENAVPILARMLNDPRLADMARFALKDVNGPRADAALRAELRRARQSERIPLIAAIGDRNDREAIADLVKLAADPDAAVRIEAIRVLGKIGGPAEVNLLAATAARGEAEALAALGALRGGEVDEAILRALDSADAETAGVLMRALESRNATGAVPALFEKANHPDPKVRAAAYQALGTLADAEQMPRLVALLMTAPSDGPDREALKSAVLAAAARQTDPEKRAMPILSAYASAPGETKAELLSMAGKLESGQTLAHLTRALKAPDISIRETAIRTLADYPDPKAAPLLLGVAQSTENIRHARLALRGYLKQAASKRLTNEEALAMYRQAAPLLEDAEEKKLWLAGLAGIGSADSLRMALPYLQDAAVGAEAHTAIVAHGNKPTPNQREICRQVLLETLAASQDPSARRALQAVLQEIEHAPQPPDTPTQTSRAKEKNK